MTTTKTFLEIQAEAELAAFLAELIGPDESYVPTTEDKYVAALHYIRGEQMLREQTANPISITELDANAAKAARIMATLEGGKVSSVAELIALEAKRAAEVSA